MKKKLLVMLVAVMCIMLCACGSSEGNNTENNQNNETTQNNSETTNNTDVSFLIGEWLCETSNFPEYYTFNEDGTCTCYGYGDCTYTVDTSTNKVIINTTSNKPWELDIIEENGIYKLKSGYTVLAPADTVKFEEEETHSLPSVEEILVDSTVEPLELFYLIQHGMNGYSSASIQGNKWGEAYSTNISFDEINLEVFTTTDEYIDNNSYIRNALGTHYELFACDNMTVTKGTCAETGKESYILSLTSTSETVEFCDTKVYVDAETFQIVYVERTASDSGYLYGASQTNKSFNTSYTYNK